MKALGAIKKKKSVVFLIKKIKIAHTSAEIQETAARA